MFSSGTKVAEEQYVELAVRDDCILTDSLNNINVYLEFI